MGHVMITTGDDTSIVDAVIALGAIFMVVVVPMMLYFRHKQSSHGPSDADRQAAGELQDQARRIEIRIEYLERVLDSEMPGWRSRV